MYVFELSFCDITVDTNQQYYASRDVSGKCVPLMAPLPRHTTRGGGVGKASLKPPPPTSFPPRHHATLSLTSSGRTSLLSVRLVVCLWVAAGGVRRSDVKARQNDK